MKTFEATEDTITLHGLGFLQIKLGGALRLHVWHPVLPRRSCFEHSSIHDHRFSFASQVLVGVQRNIVWAATPRDDGDHVAYLHEGPRTEFGNRPWLPDFRLGVWVFNTEEVPAGASYTMSAYVYHSTEPGGDGRVATLMTKVSEGQRGAHSLCRFGQTPDADFDRKQWSPGLMWEVAREVLGSAVDVAA